MQRSLGKFTTYTKYYFKCKYTLVWINQNLWPCWRKEFFNKQKKPFVRLKRDYWLQTFFVQPFFFKCFFLLYSIFVNFKTLEPFVYVVEKGTNLTFFKSYCRPKVILRQSFEFQIFHIKFGWYSANIDNHKCPLTLLSLGSFENTVFSLL